MAKEKNYKNHNNYIIPKIYVYIFWGMSYAICALALIFLSKKYYKPIEISTEANTILNIIWD